MNPGLEFKYILIGKMFHMNGNDFLKQSSRTARMLANGRTFYFGQSDIVHRVSW